jgi:NAD-dependent dihydropyrimidine dehydrogenase PreA subunit
MNELTLLARMAGEDTDDPYKLVYRTITKLTEGDPENTFRRFLFDGLLAETAYRPVGSLEAQTGAAEAILAAAPKMPEMGPRSLEVRFVADTKLDDGRFANNGWLQECPDPITRLTWDNAILVSPRMGRELGILPWSEGVLQVARTETTDWVVGREHSHVAVVRLGGRTVRGPVQIQPGMADYTIALALGYGRTHSGRAGNGSGFSAYTLRAAAAMHTAVGATIEIVAGETVHLANTQAHWSMEGRAIIREANVDEFKRDPAFAKALGLEPESPPYDKQSAALPLEVKVTEIPRGNSLYQTPKFDGVHQWGMSIDLNTCIGCAACVIACQAENNSPVVGREQVYLGREMHWIRIDR